MTYLVRGLALGTTILGLSFAGGAHAQFIDWTTSIKPGTTFTVSGVAQEFAYRSGASGVTSVDPPSTNMAASLTETLNATGEITSLTLQNANRTVTFVRANGDTFTALSNKRVIYSRASDWTREALTADPTALSWRYQTFGVWQSGVGQANGSMGATSVGAITPGASVPQTGSAIFGGVMGGLYNDASGQGYAVTADMTLNVNFAAHAATFRTVNTADRSRDRPDLNITGTFVSLPNHPALFGSLATERLAGTSSAQFYGPGAEEVGGVFTLTPKSGAGLERLAGAFGGRRGAPAGGAIGGGAPPFVSWNASRQSEATIAMQGFGMTSTVTAGGPGPVGEGKLVDVSATWLVGDDLGLYGLQMDFGSFVQMFKGSNNLYRTNYDSRILAGFYNGFIGNNVSESYGWVSGLQSDPSGYQHNYQSFGVWQSFNIPNVPAQVTVLSVGAQTPGASIPTAASATFRGQLLGVGDGYFRAEMTFNANFATRTGDLRFFDFWNNDGLMRVSSVSGSLAWQPGANLLTGQATSSDGKLTGAVQARFYGPAAQEIGGVFDLRSAPGAPQYILQGSFGGKR